MAKPFILYDNRFFDATPTVAGAVAADSDFPVANLSDPRPYTLFKQASAGVTEIIVDLGAGNTDGVDCIGIVGHNLNTAGASVVVQSSSDASSYSTILASFSPTDDLALIRQISGASDTRAFKVIVTSTLAAAEIGGLYLGDVLEMPTVPRTGTTPWTETTSLQSEVSQGGNLLGVTVDNYSVSMSHSFPFPSRTWLFGAYRTFYDNWARLKKPFFYMVDIDTWPNDAFYVWYKNPSFGSPFQVLDYAEVLTLSLDGIRQ